MDSKHPAYRTASRVDYGYVQFRSTDPDVIKSCHEAFRRLRRGYDESKDRDARLSLVLRDGRFVDLQIAEFRIRTDYSPEIERCFYDVLDTGTLVKK